MNKEKVIGISNRLNSIVDEANRHPNGNPGHITWSKAVYAIECLSKELNSKPVMPKVFDIWYSHYGTPEGALEGLMFEFVNNEHGNELEASVLRLMDWLYNGMTPASYIDSERLFKCVDAILHGYEVEK